jgi:hypothetical protein
MISKGKNVPITLNQCHHSLQGAECEVNAEKHTELGEIEVREHSEFIGRTLRDSRL